MSCKRSRRRRLSHRKGSLFYYRKASLSKWGPPGFFSFPGTLGFRTQARSMTTTRYRMTALHGVFYGTKPWERGGYGTL
jgi:hypothetical protein